MLFAKIVGGAVQAFPYTFPALRKDNPNVSFPSDMDLSGAAEYGVFLVTQQPDPAFNPATHKLVQGVPVLNGPDWIVTREVVALDANELKEVVITQDTQALKVDSQVLALLTARPAQINSYIEANVTNLTQTKDVLKILARALAVLAARTIN